MIRNLSLEAATDDSNPAPAIARLSSRLDEVLPYIQRLPPKCMNKPESEVDLALYSPPCTQSSSPCVRVLRQKILSDHQTARSTLLTLAIGTLEK